LFFVAFTVDSMLISLTKPFMIIWVETKW
jgi:hypothetical protein